MALHPIAPSRSLPFLGRASRLAPIAVACAALAILGCTDDPCPRGPVVYCTCPDGTTSTSMCTAVGAGPCLCDDASAVPDGSIPDAESLDAGAHDGGSVSMPIGASGGALSFGAITLVIPSGALASTTIVTITETTPPITGAIDRAYEIGPTGTTFAVPASVTYRYDPSALGAIDPTTLELATVSGGVWTTLAGSTVDTSRGEVSGTTAHFSVFGLVARTGFDAGLDGAAPDASDLDAASGCDDEVFLVGSDNVTPVGGALVCVRDHAEIPCVTTGVMSGSAMIAVPPTGRAVVEITHAGYLPLAIPTEWSGAPCHGHIALLRMITLGEASAIASAVGASLDLSHGIVYFGVMNRFTGAGVPGATAQLTSGTGTGPIYFAYDPTYGVIPSPSGETAAPGSGFFHTVTPGTVEVTFGNSTSMCPFRQYPGWGWLSPDPTRQEAPVFPGYVTVVETWCG